MGTEAYVATIISGGAVLVAAIFKFVPSNGHNKVCSAHSGVVKWMELIDARLSDIHKDVRALKE